MFFQSMLSRSNGQAKFKNGKVVCDGNSLTFSGYPIFLKALFDADGIATNVINAGVNGQTSAMMDADAGTEIDPNWIAGKTNLLVAYEIGNDLSESHDSAGASARFRTYCENRRNAAIANGFDLKIVVCTVTPRNNLLESLILPCNETLKSTYLQFAHAIADFRTDPRLMAFSNPLYYLDGVHWTELGRQIAAGIIYTAIKRIP